MVHSLGAVGLALLGFGILPPPARAETDARGLRVSIELVGLRSDGGVVLVALYRSADGFPDHPERAVAVGVSRVRNRRAAVVLRGVRSGIYAVAAIHDENNNRRLDTNWIGIPKEGVAASNNATGTFGPPSFKAASFQLGSPGIHQTLRMRYY